MTRGIPRTANTYSKRPENEGRPRGKGARKKRRRKLKLVSCFLIFLVILVFVTLSLTVLFEIEQFSVSGESVYTEEQIIEASGIQTGENLFMCRRSQAAEDIETKLPYIESAQVKIGLPNTLKISVVMAQTAAILNLDGQQMIISQKGKVLGPADGSQPEGLLEINGLPVSSAEVGKPLSYTLSEESGQEGAIPMDEILTDTLNAVANSGLTQIRSITFQGVSITLDYAGRIQIKLGTTTNIQTKMENAKLLIEQYIAEDEAGTLDFSVNENKPIFDPDYDTPTVVIPPDSASSGENASSSAPRG